MADHSTLIDGKVQTYTSKPTTAPTSEQASYRVQVSTNPARVVHWVYNFNTSQWVAIGGLPVFGTDGSPTSISFEPDYRGQFYWDDFNTQMYYASDTTSTGWRLLGSGGGGGGS